MKKPTAKEIKTYTEALKHFNMPPQPLLTLDGVQKKPDKKTINEITKQPEEKL